MPEKIITNDSLSISHYVGFVGAGISALTAGVGLVVRSFLKKQDTLEKTISDEKEKTIAAIWKRIDEHSAQLTEIEKSLACTGGRFEDLQRAHFEMTCKNIMKRE
jgi:hypothetical protein